MNGNPTSVVTPRRVLHGRLLADPLDDAADTLEALAYQHASMARRAEPTMAGQYRTLAGRVRDQAVSVRQSARYLRRLKAER